MQKLIRAFRFGLGAYRILRRGDEPHLIAMPITLDKSLTELREETLNGWSWDTFYKAAFAMLASFAQWQIDQNWKFFYQEPSGHIRPLEIFTEEKDNVILFPRPRE